MDGKILSKQGMLRRALLPLGDGSHKDQAFVIHTLLTHQNKPLPLTLKLIYRSFSKLQKLAGFLSTTTNVPITAEGCLNLLGFGGDR